MIHDGDSFRGQLKTPSICTETAILPSRARSSVAQPGYRVTAGGDEIGAGWGRRAEASGRD